VLETNEKAWQTESTVAIDLSQKASSLAIGCTSTCSDLLAVWVLCESPTIQGSSVPDYALMGTYSRIVGGKGCSQQS
jgi:hypothetical protein